MEGKRGNDPEKSPAIKFSEGSDTVSCPNDEIRRREVLELTEGLVMLNVRVKNLETSRSESKRSSTPQSMRKSQSDRDLDDIKEELKQVKLAQERRSDAMEICPRRHEEEMDDFKSKTEMFEEKRKTTESIVGSLQIKIDSKDKNFGEINDRFDCVDKRFDSVDKRFDSVDKRFDSVDKRFDSIDKRFDTIEEKMNSIESKLSCFNDILVANHSFVCEKIENGNKAIGEKIDNLSRWLENTLEK